MQRAQILLEEEQERRLDELAARTGRSKSSLVREAIDLLLADRDEELPHPLLGLIGCVRSGRSDGAEKHDEIIYGNPHGESD